MAGSKSANFLHTSGPKSPRKIIVKVLEKHVRLVTLTYASPKVNVTASKLVPRKERLGPRGLKRSPNNLSFIVIVLVSTVSVRNFCVCFFVFIFFVCFFFSFFRVLVTGQNVMLG